MFFGCFLSIFGPKIVFFGLKKGSKLVPYFLVKTGGTDFLKICALWRGDLGGREKKWGVVVKKNLEGSRVKTEKIFPGGVFVKKGSCLFVYGVYPLVKSIGRFFFTPRVFLTLPCPCCRLAFILAIRLSLGPKVPIFLPLAGLVIFLNFVFKKWLKIMGHFKTFLIG